MINLKNRIVTKIVNVLDRRDSIESLVEVRNAISDPALSTMPKISECAIVLDTNVIIKLVAHKKMEDIVDYLSGQHKKPLVVSGQSIQEFWNNRFSEVETVADKMNKKINELKPLFKELDGQFDEYEQKFTDLLTDFERDFGQIYDQRSIEGYIRIFNVLNDISTCKYAPRERFIDIAKSRNETKTPPGFKDSGHGDFFVWCDMLYSLLLVQIQKEVGFSDFKGVVFITNDVKKDWSLNGIAHPILCAEVKALLKVPFCTYKLDDFASLI